MPAATNTQPGDRARADPRATLKADLYKVWCDLNKPTLTTNVGPGQTAVALHFYPLSPIAAQAEGQAIDSNRRNQRIPSSTALHSQRAPTPSPERSPQTGSESSTSCACVHTPASPEIWRGQHASLADGDYIVHEPVDLQPRQLTEENALGPAFKQLPDDAQKDIRFLVTRFAYDASVSRAEDNRFDIVFHKEHQRGTSRKLLPPQSIQQVYFAANHHPVLVTFKVPLSAPLHWKVSKPSDKTWTLLEEILHCPDPDQFPMQHRMWRLFHDDRRQQLVQDYLDIQTREQKDPDNDATHLGDCAELGLYMFSIGRPPRIWTVGGDKSEAVGFPEGSVSCFGGCMFTYDEADLLLLTETEHAIWAAHNNAPKNILLFDEAFNRRRPGKSMAAWLQELEVMAEEEPSTMIDVQDLASPKYDQGTATLAVKKMPIERALQLYREFDPERPVSVGNPPSNFLNITDEQPGHWPQGLCKSYNLLRQLVQQVESRQFSGYQDTEGTPDTGKPRTSYRTAVDMAKCQQFRIAAAAGAASDFHMDQSGVYTFVHLEKNTDDGKESAEDAIKYWPSYPLDGLSQAEQHIVRMDFAKSSAKSALWRPRPPGGIPVLIILGGYMLIQRPGNIHAPITLTSCFFLGGMAWKDSTLKHHLEITKFLAENPDCTNEASPSQIQPILLALRRKVRHCPESYGYSSDPQDLDDLDGTIRYIYSKVTKCNCSGPCTSGKCTCVRLNVKCGDYCHPNPSAGPSKKGCPNRSEDYLELKRYGHSAASNMRESESESASEKEDPVQSPFQHSE